MRPTVPNNGKLYKRFLWLYHIPVNIQSRRNTGLLNRRKNTPMSHFFYGGMLHEYSLAGLYFSPMALFSMLALISTLITRKILTVLKLRQLVWAGAWFDLSVYMIYLAATVYFIGV